MNISDSTVSIVCGIAPEQLEALVRDRSRPLQDLADTQKELIGRLQEQLDLNQAQIRAALNATGEADIAPDAIAAKLVEIAGRYRQLLAQVDGAAADDPEAARLKAEARESLDRGDLDHADRLLARLSTLQDEAEVRQAMEAAATPARRAAVALTRLRYLEAAGHFAAAADGCLPGTRTSDWAIWSRPPMPSTSKARRRATTRRWPWRSSATASCSVSDRASRRRWPGPGSRPTSARRSAARPAGRR